MIRTAILLILLLLCGTASAENYYGTTEGDAKAKCESSKAKIASKYPAECVHYPTRNPKVFVCEGRGAGAGYTCDGLVQFMPAPKPTGVYGHHYYQTDCEALGSENIRNNESRDPNWNGNACIKGCLYTKTIDIGTCSIIVEGPGVAPEQVGYNCWYPMSTTGQTCSEGDDGEDPPPPEPPKECSDGQVRLPNGQCADRGKCPVGQHMVSGKCEPDGACPTGKIKAPDSSCVDETCPAGQTKGKDGTCKKDDDGDGDPNDGEDDGKFSGGEDCKTPPQCSGDNILCGQVRIQWRIDCNTRKNTTVSGGGGCDAPPVCAGEKCNAIEYSSLLQQWRTACATEKLARGSGTGTGEQQPGWTKADGMNQNPGQGGSAGDTDIWKTGDPIDGSGLDSSGFVGGGGTCPGFGAASGGGSLSGGFFSQLASPPPMWCGFINWAGIVINVFALIGAIYILARP